MLTLNAILRTTRHLRSYGSDGKHQFGNEPRTPTSEDKDVELSAEDTTNQSQKD